MGGLIMIRILLADDHEIVRSGIKLLIENEPDMQVISETSSGADAVREAVEKKPDIVIMDLNMPDKNGFIATKQIKEQLATEETKVIILTMHDEREYISRAIKSGISGYVLKSHDVSDLIEAIRIVNSGQAFLDPNATKELIHEYVELTDMKKRHPQLSGREQEIISYLAKGYTNKEVSEKLYLSVKTIESHRANIMRKLNVSARHELVEYAIANDLLILDSHPSKKLEKIK